MLPLVKDLSIVLAGIVALFTLWVGLAQNARGLRGARAAEFVGMRRRFLEDATFRRLLTLLAEGSGDIARESIQDRRNLVGFLEEVALMVNSGIIRPEVARYMFGYYVRLVDASDAFWTGLDRGSEYWTLFHDFAARQRADDRTKTLPSRLRL